MPLQQIISGGQTGVDQLALKVAKDLGLDWGGWAPKGWRTEDGAVPEVYRARMTESADGSYPARTKQNVAYADATLVCMDVHEGRGSRLAMNCAAQLDKPYMWFHVIDIDSLVVHDFIRALVGMIEETDVHTLNVAGTRGSRCRLEFLSIVRDVLTQAIERTRA